MALNSDVEVILNGAGNQATTAAQKIYNNSQAIIAMAEAITDLQSNRLKKKVVSELPSKNAVYDFEDGVSHITSISKMSAEVVDGTQIVTVEALTGLNQFGCGYIDLSTVTVGADSITIEYDNVISEGSRWWISLVDLDERPGASSGSAMDNTGVAFRHGTNSGSIYWINDKYSSTWSSFFGSIVHVRVVIDFTAKTVTYTVSNDEVTASESYNLAVPQITGIEFYSWLTGAATTIDNIHVIANFKADENTIYLIPDGDGYAAYMYVDSVPYRI